MNSNDSFSTVLGAFVIAEVLAYLLSALFSLDFDMGEWNQVSKWTFAILTLFALSLITKYLKERFRL